MTPYPPIDWLRTLRIYLSASAILHLVWETLQLPLYAIWSTGNLGEIAFAVLHCTAGDLMIASLSLLVALVAIGNRAWPSERFIPVMATTIVIGIGYTVYSEWLNTVVRKTWEYSELMPTIPILGSGLSPLLQWVIVPTVGFALIRSRYARNSTRR
ncbi:MAG: hypothetical protein HYX37_17220 [Rhizobiales bacterium]|nr:hypothetical protein [Hyphomicrobiales bacterium]